MQGPLLATSYAQGSEEGGGPEPAGNYNSDTQV